MRKEERKIWIVGHKNPDSDSICAAIAYAELKNKTDPIHTYEARRAGHINEETRYVLDYFHVPSPAYVGSVGTQVKDIDIRKTKGVGEHISLKEAWGIMKNENIVTLPVTNRDNELLGLIITGDIAMSYMDVYDKSVMSAAKTPYKNIVETLDGALLVGNEDACFTEGSILVGAGNPETMEEFIHEHDLIILGNRYESQICAMEKNVSCMVICADYKVPETIQRIAKEKGVAIISTPYDTFTVARLINQSMPVGHFMRRENLITFEEDAYIHEISEVMSKERHRDFPVLNRDGSYVGMISRRNLLNLRKKQIILVDHNEKTQAVDGIDEAEILEIIDHHRLGSLETLSPVFFRNQPLGSTSTIVYLMYKEAGVELTQATAGLLCAAIISDTLMYRSPTCTQVDRECAQELATIAGVSVEELAQNMFRAGSDFTSKTAEEIVYQDFKTFSVSGVEFGVGQVSSMSQEDLGEVKQKLQPYLDTVIADRNVGMVFFMLTNILEESSELIYAGEGAGDLIRAAYEFERERESYELKGVVSRKKQLIPDFISALQQ